MKSDIDDLNAKILKLTLDSQIADAKSKKKIEQLQCLVAEKTQEISQFKKQLNTIKKQKITMENELFTLKAGPNINVSYWLIIFPVKK